MAGSARTRLFREFMARFYPAFSRRATQVCILSSALEKIEGGTDDPRAVALAALAEADAFGWNERQARRRELVYELTKVTNRGRGAHVIGVQGVSRGAEAQSNADVGKSTP